MITCQSVSTDESLSLMIRRTLWHVRQSHLRKMIEEDTSDRSSSLNTFNCSSSIHINDYKLIRLKRNDAVLSDQPMPKVTYCHHATDNSEKSTENRRWKESQPSQCVCEHASNVIQNMCQQCINDILCDPTPQVILNAFLMSDIVDS